METKNGPETPSGGMDQSLKAPRNKASLVKNYRVDSDLGWINDRGWEPRIDLGTPFSISTGGLEANWSPVRFLSIWSRHQNAEVYYLEERGGNLRYGFANQGTATARYILLDGERNEPKVDEPGTQIAPFGRFALILNGHDAPLKFWGREVVEPFSWASFPPVPHVLGVDTEAGADSEVLDVNLIGTAACLKYSATGYHGLGASDVDSISSFSYRIAFKSNTGSISPLSPPAVVSWTIGDANEKGRYAVFMDDLPIGPPGTVARIIYRTKNKKDGVTGAGDVWYYVAEVSENLSKMYVDHTPDNELVDAIDPASFAQPISHGYKYASSFNNQMFLGGGEAHPTRIIFSRPNLPEEFPRYYYFDVGNSIGGHITGLYAYYNSLLVFREKSIDVITVSGVDTNSAPLYRISTLDQNIGTTATNTIKYVPGVGVVFLSRDGFYAITGGLEGGAIHRVQKISTGISKEMKRLSTGALARATATFSDREKEYWCHYPADGDTENSRGAVLHTQTGEWSLRNTMRFTQLATDPNGWIIIGTYQNAGDDTSLMTTYPGLQVWSANPYWGKQVAYSSVDGMNTVFTSTDVERGESVWESVWDDFGSSTTKKAIKFIEIEVLSQGNNDIELMYAADYGETFTSAGSVKAQQAEYTLTASSQPVMGSNATVPKAKWGTSKWQGGHVIRMRWDVDTSYITQFKFKIETSNLFHIISYKVNYTTDGKNTLSTQNPSHR